MEVRKRQGEKVRRRRGAEKEGEGRRRRVRDEERKT